MATIVQRNLVRFAPQRNGDVVVIEDHHDDSGKVQRVKYRDTSGTLTEQQATDAMNARDVSSHLERQEERELYQHLLAGNSFGSFPLNWLSSLQARRRILRAFMKNSVRTDKPFMCRVAGQLAGLTVQQIENAAQVTTEQATRIRNRAIRYDTVICPALDVDPEDL